MVPDRLRAVGDESESLCVVVVVLVVPVLLDGVLIGVHPTVAVMPFRISRGTPTRNIERTNLECIDEYSTPYGNGSHADRSRTRSGSA
jgi:hypothetical protein